MNTRHRKARFARKALRAALRAVLRTLALANHSSTISVRSRVRLLELMAILPGAVLVPTTVLPSLPG